MKQKPKNNRMMRDQGNYDKLLAAYRAAPGNHTVASRVTGWTIPACRYVWNTGWAVKRRGHVTAPGCDAIKDVLQREKDAARAQAMETARKERDLADAEAARARAARIDALAREQEIITETGKACARLMPVVHRLNGLAHIYANIVQDAVCTFDPVTGQLATRANPAVTSAQALKVIRDISLIAQRSSSAVESFVKLARLDRGETTANVGVSELEDPNDVLDELSAAATLHDRLTAGRQAEHELGEDDEPPPVLQ